MWCRKEINVLCVRESPRVKKKKQKTKYKFIKAYKTIAIERK